MARFSDQDLREMPPEVLRSILRENTHHQVEEPLYEAIYEGSSFRPSRADRVRHLLEIWRERGLPEEGADFEWMHQLLQVVKDWNARQDSTQSEHHVRPFSEVERTAIERAIFERRSVRRWTDQPVPRAMVEKIIEAALWAPHACNLQTIRVLWIESERDRALFEKSEVTGGKVILVICQDLRPYECTAGVPERNRLLDCGAAVQNMLLMAHAIGLGAVWLTFSPPQERQLREHFHLPAYIAIQTYIALGYPDASPLPPGRLKVSDVLLNAETQ